MRRILVVDDSALARRAARMLFARQGIQPVEAASLTQALAMLSPLPDAALLDLELGDGLGIGVADALRELGSRCPIAFMTASIDEGLLALARTRGPVFNKPDGIASAINLLLSADVVG